jgi:GTP cyclohydrolase I
MSFNKTKTDLELGLEIHNHLVSLGVETPVTEKILTSSEKINIIQDKFYDIMVTLGLDLTDDSLADTPKRVAKMFVNEIFWGLDYDAFPKCTTIQNKMGYNEMLIERNINVQSNCEHHFE